MTTRTTPANVPGNAFDKQGSRNPLIRAIMRRFEATVLDAVKRCGPRSILEVGAGEGHVSRMLATRFGPDLLISTELEPGPVQESRRLYPDLRFARADIYGLPFADRSFDLIICCEVMEHLVHPREALQELLRVTAKNVVLTVPNEPWWRMANLARGYYLREWGNTPGHLNHWSTGAFRSLVAEQARVVRSGRIAGLWSHVLAER